MSEHIVKCRDFDGISGARMSEYIVKCRVFDGISGKTLVCPEYVDLNQEVVRCRDCIYYKQDPDPIDPGWPMMCERTGDDMVEPYGFCAWGIRREHDD